MTTERAALINGDGLVTSVALVNVNDQGQIEDWEPPDGLTVQVLADDSTVGPGWTHTTGEFQAPPPPPDDGTTTPGGDAPQA
jgi:hypothetical protein